MRVALAWLAFVLTAACNGGGGGVPDASTDDAALSCTQLRDALRMKLATVSRACQSASECGVVGVAQNTFGHTCDCAPAFASPCSGVAVNSAAWLGDPSITSLTREWDARCRSQALCGTEPICACDCGIGQVGCSNGGCVASLESCLAPPTVDAAVD